MKQTLSDKIILNLIIGLFLISMFGLFVEFCGYVERNGL
jgi:hypothetical protein